MDNKFQNGKIYKITSPHTDKCYIGSTTESLTRRLNTHFIRYKNDATTKRKISSIEIIKCGDAKIELIKDFPCNSKRELEQEETKYILLDRDNCVNKNLPCKLEQKIYRREYKLKNIEKIKEQRKKCRELNINNILSLTRKNDINTFNCYCGSSIHQYEKNRHFKTKKHLNYLEHNIVTK